MSCNSCGNYGLGNSCWWIIILILLFGMGGNCGSSCGCDNSCC